MRSHIPTVLASLTLLFAATSLSMADDRFQVGLGAHDSLMIFGPNGQRVAELPVPSISTPVTIGATTFQVSYGRDVNNMLTAILAPNPSQPQDLHFNVLNKAVDSDKQAVVTLTFTSPNKVSVDPGYIGVVQVNSHTVKHRELADSGYVPSSSGPAPRPTSDIAPVYPASIPVTYDSQQTTASYTPPAAPQQKEALYWSEPVTAPDGTVPQVSSNEMKLVEVQGPVSVRTASGVTKDGEEGMIVPSGSTVSTAPGASAAVFMGGVNSVRILPASEAQISQHVSGSVRNTTIDLHDGTVFSRVGRRAGETQDYEVRTPEGVAAARGTELADHRGHGHHYVFVAKGIVEEIDSNGHVIDRLTGGGGVGKGAMPPAGDIDEVFQQIMKELQPFNTKLQTVINHIHDGTATPREIAFYNNLKNTFFQDFGPAGDYDPHNPLAFAMPITSDSGNGGVHGPDNNPDNFPNFNDPTTHHVIPSARRATNQDFEPFGTQPLTPF